MAKAPPALGFASWEIDAASAPAADATTLSILAREGACANGKPPAERVLPPIVDETVTTDTITLLVRRCENAHCQRSPAYPVEIVLSAPLGERALLDGSTYPASERK